MLLNTYTPFHYKDSWLLELVSCSKHSQPPRCPTPERFTSCLIRHICLHLSDIPQAILISFISSNFLQSHFHINRCVWSVYYVMVSLPKHFQEQFLYENRGQSVLKLQKRGDMQKIELQSSNASGEERIQTPRKASDWTAGCQENREWEH